MLSRKYFRLSWLASALFVAGAVGVIHAQTLDDPVAVPVDFHGRALMDGDGEMHWQSKFSVSFDPNTQVAVSTYTADWMDATTSSNPTVSPARTTPYNTAFMKPGKDYYFSVSLTRIAQYEVHFDAPQGTRLYINDVDSRVFSNSGGATDLNGSATIKVRLESDAAAPTGEPSSLRPGRVIWSVGMGQLMNGRPAGSIMLREDGLTASSFTPAALIYDIASSEVQCLYSGTALRQVFADQALVDITTDNDHAFRLKFYPRVQVSTSTDSTTGLYTTTGDPLYEYVIENPDYPTVDKLRITKITRQNAPAYTMWTELQQSSSTQWRVIDWNDGPVGGSGTNYTDWTYANNNLDETIEVHDGAGNLVARTANHYTTYAWGMELTSSTAGDQLPNPVVTSYDYYTDPNAEGNYKKLKSIVYSGGSWIKYDYYDDLGRLGQVSHVYKPWGDAPADPSSASTTTGEVTTMDYAADWLGDQRRLSSAETRVNNVVTARSTIAYDETGTVDGMPIVTATRSDSPIDGQSLTTVTKTFREDADGTRHFYPGLLHSIKQPDGTMDVAIYLRGIFNPGSRTFAPSTGGAEWENMTFHGTSLTGSGAVSLTSFNAGDQVPSLEPDFNVVPSKTTDSFAVHASDGTVVLTVSDLCTGATTSRRVQRDLMAYDSFIFPDYVQRDSGDTTRWYVANNVWKNGRLDSSTDEKGTTQQFTYDTYGRLLTRTQVAMGPIPTIETSYGYDAVGHVTSETLGATAASNQQLTTTQAYDVAGRRTSVTVPGHGTTTFDYDPSSRSVTTNLPTGSSQTEELYLDGRSKQVTGSAVVAKYFTYDIRSSDGFLHTRVDVGSSGDVRNMEQWADWLGRPATIRRPGFNGGSPFDENYSYDGVGRLQQKSRTGYAPMLYVYDNLSRLIESGLDLDGTGTLVPNSSDRVTDYAQDFEQDANSTWWSIETASVYPYNNGTAQTIRTKKTRLTGLSDSLRGEIHTIDANGVETIQTLTATSASATLAATTTRTGYTGSEIQTAVNGLMTSVTHFDGLQYGVSYDEAGRVVTTTDPRTGATTTHYYDNTAQVSEVDAPGGQVTKYGYDGAGRLQSKQWGGAGDTPQITYYGYTARGEVGRQWGSAYPVQYGYDSYGQRISMSTWQDPQNTIDWSQAGWGAATSTTTWTFDAGSGLLQKKTDAAGQFVEYDYNSRGQTAHRYWARTLPNSSTRVTTTYAYYGDNAGEPATGELREVSYNDGFTPAVDYTYSRLGQIATVNDHVTDQRTFNYDAANGQMLRLSSLQLGAFYGSRVMTPQYDSIWRDAGVDVGTGSNPGADLAQVFGYTGDGRVDHVDTTSDVEATRRFTYGYTLSNSPLVTSLTSGAFSVSRGYDPNRDLLQSIDSQWSGASKTRYDYTYNTLGQRSTAKQSGASGTAFSDFGNSTYYRYVYNSRGEVVDAAGYLGSDVTQTTQALAERHFAYGYDNVGNRLTESRTGSAGAANHYTPNALNQYGTRENNAAYVTGTVAAGSTVNVAGGTVTPSVATTGQYWGTQIMLANGSGPASTSVTTSATLNGAVRSEVRTAYLAQALQTFTHDADGNLIGDGVWTYTYDAENRLIGMTTTALAINAGFPSRLLDFKYDYLGRRVQKHVQNGPTGTETWRRYLYDGNNLIAEFDAPGGTSCGSTLRSYTWGLDVAQSLSATGGVGALLQITDHTTRTSYFPTYDGNGNVASLINAADGTIAAAYEYSPFGELLRAEGSYAAANPFRFSTKFTDDETGLVYYGARYYSPSLGRFINRDPIAEAGGINLYGFCGNDGVDQFDVLGNFSLRDTLHKLKHWVSNHIQIVSAVAGILSAGALLWAAPAAWALTTTTGLLTTTGMVATGAVAGAVSSMTSAALSGQSFGQVLKSGIIGGAIGGLAAYAGAVAVGHLPTSLSFLTTNSIPKLASEGFISGAVSAGLNTAVYGGKAFDSMMKSGLISAAEAGGTEAIETAWYYLHTQPAEIDAALAKARLEAAADPKIGPEAMSQVETAFRTAFEKYDKIQSLSAFGTLIGGTVGAAAGYLVGHNLESAAVGALVGGAAGYYTSGLDLFGKFNGRFTDGVHVSGEISGVPRLLDIPIQSKAFDAGGSFDWDGALWGGAPMQHSGFFHDGAGALNQNLPGHLFYHGLGRLPGILYPGL